VEHVVDFCFGKLEKQFQTVPSLPSVESVKEGVSNVKERLKEL
jgi:hypothetical protein